MHEYIPHYLKLLDSCELENRVADSYTHLSKCDVCALNCPVDRLSGKLGACKTGKKAIISSFMPHHGEEKPLSGRMGSGTIFFSRCNLKCQFCQNYDISQSDYGEEIYPVDIARMMLNLQSYGCHNINFVSPSHVVPQILEAILIAAKKGLRIPLVYNTGGYDSIPMLKLLDDVIDIYMPDMKYGDASIAQKYSRIPRYPEVNQNAVKEMHRQVGDLYVNIDGLAMHGLLVRHLILPNNLAGTDIVSNFLADNISVDTYINLMDQYRPVYNAKRFPEINRRITPREYQYSIKMAADAGLHRFER